VREDANLLMVRRLAFAITLVLLLLLTGVFAYSNPQPIDVDIGFMRFEQVSMAVAFAVVLALGWLLGLLSAGLALWRSAGEKRRLQQDLKYAEAELRVRPPSP
jgi:protein-S-isoprenylcysteine O-methyltransferase Ste14